MPILSAGFLALLSRRTSGRALIPEIDGLRSVAIMSVVFFHAAGYFAAAVSQRTDGTAIDRHLSLLLSVFDYGVPIFFVISGFILTLPFAAHHLRADSLDEPKPRPSLKHYFLRRITRLEPPYIVALSAMLGLKLAGIISVPDGDNSPTELLKHFAAQLFYVHNLIYHDIDSMLLGLAWSLEVEVQFYILAPLLTLLFKLPNAALRRLILILAIGALSRLFGVDKPADGLSLLNHAPYFLAGMLLADLHLAGLDRGPRRTNPWDLVALLSLSACFLAPAYGFAPRLTVPWLVLIAFAAVFRAGLVRSFFRAPPVVILGGMCYSIYLWHSTAIGASRPFLLRLTGADPDWPTRLAFILLAAIPAVAISAVFFLLIERPTMIPRWPQKLLGLLRRQK